MKFIEEGREAPSQFYEQPELNDHLRFYWDAFFELSTERQMGMGVGPIPRYAIRAYASEFDIVGDWFDSFCRVIRGMDEAYLKLVAPVKDREVANTVSADDPEGVARLFKKLQARHAVRKQ